MSKKRVKLRAEELQQLKWLVGSCLSLLALWALSSLEMQSSSVVLVAAGVVLLSIVSPRIVSRIPSKLWRPIGFVVLLIVIVDFALHLPEFMPPLLRMVILLLLFKTLAPRKRRDDLQITVLCLFCLVISGVLTVSLLFALQILIFTPVAMGMLFMICLLDRGSESRVRSVDWERFQYARLLGKVLRVVDYRVLFLGAVMFGFVVFISTLLFILTPRIDLDQAIPYLQIKTQTRAGFSENVKLGAVTDIQSDNSVALRIDVPSYEAIDGTPYWRILALDKYDQGYFRLSNDLRDRPYRSYLKIRELMGRELLSDSTPRERKSSYKWTLYLEGNTSQFLPLPGMFYSMRFEGLQDLVLMPGQHHVGLRSVQQRVFSYQIEDLDWTHRFPAMQIEVDAFSAVPMQFESEDVKYPMTNLELNLVSEERAYLADLNEQIVGGQAVDDVGAYSKLVTDYLWKNYSYSVSPNLSGNAEDAIVRWMQNAKSGHCEYFAAAYILLAREAGYPARMVVGFAGGSWNVVEEYFVVRNDDAHAWVEIYDAKSREWLRVDPTPGNGSSDPDIITSNVPSFESGVNAWIDSLRIQWYRRVVNFDQSDQIDMAISAKTWWDRFSERFSEKVKSIGASLQKWWQQPFSSEGIVRFVVLFCSALMVWGFWRSRYTLLGCLYRILRRPKALDPIRLQARRYLRKMRTKQVDGEIVDELMAMRFGPPVKRTKAKEVFERARKALRKSQS